MLISFTKVWAIKSLFSHTAQGAYGPTNSKGVLRVSLWAVLIFWGWIFVDKDLVFGEKNKIKELAIVVRVAIF